MNFKFSYPYLNLNITWANFITLKYDDYDITLNIVICDIQQILSVISNVIFELDI
jgi:hypothetical protein